MAATQKKSTAAKKKSTSRSGSGRTKKASPPPKRPVRREVWGVTFLVLALCVFVSYFGIEAIFINAFAKLLTGLFGYGYYLTGPAFLLSGLILIFHHGRPVQLRVTCTLLLPVLLGALCHMVLCKVEFPASAGTLKQFWVTGTAVTSGGAVCGTIAEGFVRVFSKVASIILFTALLAAAGMVSLQVTFRAMVEKHRSRPQYEPEEPRIHVTPLEPVRRSAEQRRAVIDIPLDETDVSAAAPREEKKEPGRFTGFFRHKSDQQRTPDQVLSEPETEQKREAKRTPAIPAAAVETAQSFAGVSAAPVRPAAAETRPSPEPRPAAEVRPAAETLAAPEENTGKRDKQSLAREVAEQTAAVTAEIQEKLSAEGDEYQFPPITLLEKGGQENFAEAGAELRNNSRRLAETLTSFGVDATPGDVIHGPSVTRYEFVLDQGVKLSKITNLADDIALALGATGVRIAPIPAKISVVGIEVPNKQVTPVLIRDVIESRAFTEHKSKVAFALGKDIGGRCIVGDIEKLPHVLIAGTTGSGKSVCTNSLIVSLLYKSTPDQVRFIMVDPKMVELAPYNGIPHLLIPVVTDPKKAAGALQWAVFEMMKRYKTFSERGVKKLEEYNRLARTTDELETLPSVVVVIDELADLMLVAAKEVEESICRVAQMGRAAGVHLVIATQRPSADVITGLMKANIPSRIAFAVASSLESRIILDNTGAEKLVGRGDMLYAPLGAGKPTRVQGCFISPEEIEQVVAFVKQSGEAHYSDEVMAKIEESVQEKEKGGAKGAAAEPSDDEGDELLPAAVDVVLETGQASVSMLQRRLKLGYSRAARLVDQMEERGIVGPFEGSKPRQLLITREKWQEMQMGSAPEAQSPADGED